MKYFWLAAKDQRRNNFVFFQEATASLPVAVRGSYADLQCPKCKKIDEIAALQRGIEDGVHFVARQDFVQCCFGQIAASLRLRTILREHDIRGVDFVDIPSNPNYAIVVPSTIAETDLGSCGMEFHRRCTTCGRFRETCFLPPISSMTTPNNDLVIFSTSVRIESTRGAVQWFLVSNTVKMILLSEQVSGVEYMACS